MSDKGGSRVVRCGQLVSGQDGIYVPSKTTGNSSTLPMNDDQKQAAAEREKTRTIGFTQPQPEPPVIGLA